MEARSTSRSTDSAPRGDDREFLIVGLILGPHGMRGEVRVDVRSDVDDRFRPGARLLCDGIGELVIDALRAGPKGPLVRFRGYPTRESAEALAKRFLRVTRDEARRANAGAYLWADLVGLRVVSPEGAELGQVSDVLRAGETDVLVIRRADGREQFAPMLESVVSTIDLEGRRIVVAPQPELG